MMRILAFLCTLMLAGLGCHAARAQLISANDYWRYPSAASYTAVPNDSGSVFSAYNAGAGVCPGGTFTTTQTVTSGTVTGACITTTSGPCFVASGGGTITIEASQIGPCGDNGTTNASQGIYVTGGTTVNLYDNYIHVENQASNCTPQFTHAGLYVYDNGTAAVASQGNVFAFNQDNIAVWDSSNVSDYGSFLLNPRGDTACTDADNLYGYQVEAWGDAAMSGISISYDYLWSCPTGYPYGGLLSNAIDLGNSGAGNNSGAVASHNWIGTCGGQGTYANAAGIVFDSGSTGGTASSNVISELYNSGIALAAGSGYTVSGNKILLAALTTGSATGITIIGATCPISVTGNVMSAFQGAPPDTGYNQAFYNSGSCGSPTVTGNTDDTGCSGGGCTAYTALYPMATTNPPPLIPPVPKNCVANTPYSTQTGLPCSGSGRLTLTLPANANTLPSGWHVTVVNDNGNQASVQVNATSGGQILYPAAHAVSAATTAPGNYEFLSLEYDNSGNFRVTALSPQTAIALGVSGAGGGGDVSGPGSSTDGWAPTWSGASGTVLTAGHPVANLGADTVMETDSSGRLDVTTLPATAVTGPGSSADGYAARWSGGSGTVLATGSPVGNAGANTVMETDASGHLATSTLNIQPSGSGGQPLCVNGSTLYLGSGGAC
jgi:hypothetical protein